MAPLPRLTGAALVAGQSPQNPMTAPLGCGGSRASPPPLWGSLKRKRPVMTTAAHTPGPWESTSQFIVAPDPKGIHPDIYIAEIVEADDSGRIAAPEQ